MTDQSRHATGLQQFTRTGSGVNSRENDDNVAQENGKPPNFIHTFIDRRRTAATGGEPRDN
jgi:hypothetical protein